VKIKPASLGSTAAGTGSSAIAQCHSGLAISTVSLPCSAARCL